MIFFMGFNFIVLIYSAKIENIFLQKSTILNFIQSVYALALKIIK